ncbi:MAG TPA: tetratricopeptide repeat protein, partial [Ktedonobacterales bacterium]
MSNSQITSALREAQQLQQEGRIGEAVAICEELLESGVDRPDVHYFLGWLCQEADRWEDAASQFELLLEDPEYALSCYYALGQCARALGREQDAARYFDEAVDRVNLDALTQDECDQLLQLCQEAAEAHRDMRDVEGAETIFSALLGYLRSQNWQDQVNEVERMMRDTLGTNPPAARRQRDASSSRNLSENIPHRANGRLTGEPVSGGANPGAANLVNASRPGVAPQDLDAPPMPMPMPDAAPMTPAGVDPFEMNPLNDPVGFANARTMGPFGMGMDGVIGMPPPPGGVARGP